jgi:hypothetical protein
MRRTGNTRAGDGVEEAGLDEAVSSEHPAHLAGQGQDQAGGQVAGAEMVGEFGAGGAEGGCVIGAPAVLRLLDELERQGQPGPLVTFVPAHCHHLSKT